MYVMQCKYALFAYCNYNTPIPTLTHPIQCPTAQQPVPKTSNIFNLKQNITKT